MTSPSPKTKSRARERQRPEIERGDVFSAEVHRRVIAALDRFVAADPPTGDVRKLADAQEWRLRVGDWRVRFERDPALRVIYVLRVLPRGRAYRA